MNQPPTKTPSTAPAEKAFPKPVPRFVDESAEAGMADGKAWTIWRRVWVNGDAKLKRGEPNHAPTALNEFATSLAVLLAGLCVGCAGVLGMASLISKIFFALLLAAFVFSLVLNYRTYEPRPKD